MIESMGSELYAYFELEGGRVESDQLSELAVDAGVEEVPGSGEGQVVARLDAASKVSEDDEAELWLDAAKLHFFDPDSGESLATRS